MVQFYLYSLIITWGLWLMVGIRCKWLVNKYNIQYEMVGIDKLPTNAFKLIMLNSIPVVNLFRCIIYFFLFLLTSDKVMLELIDRGINKK